MEKEQKKLSSGVVILIITLVVALVTVSTILALELLKKDDVSKQQITGENSELKDIETSKVENKVEKDESTTIVENKVEKEETTVVENKVDEEVENTDKGIENDEINLKEFAKKQGDFEVFHFTISKIEETKDGYTISANILDDEVRKVSKTEYDKVLKGGTIKFRGREWVYGLLVDEYNDYNDKSIVLKEKNEEKLSSVDLSRYYNNGYKDYYTFKNNAGKESFLKDYKSNETITFSVDKDIKVGDTFEKFEYDEKTKTVKVKDYKEEYEKQDINTTKSFMENFREFNTASTYGECYAYMINGKVVAIRATRASAP